MLMQLRRAVPVLGGGLALTTLPSPKESRAVSKFVAEKQLPFVAREQLASQAKGFVASLHAEGLKQVMDKVKAEYGEELFDMLQALSEVTQKASSDLNVSGMKYGMMPSLPLVRLQHVTKDPPKTAGQLMKDPDLAAQARHWADFALGAYGAAPPEVAEDADDRTKVSKALGFALRSVVDVKMASLPATGVATPGHFVAIDSQRRAVVLGVRGTVNLSDAITDAVGNSVAFPEYPGVETHQAILNSARAVLQRTRGALVDALAANPGFGVVITGHSLGAGTAILCTLLLEASPLPGNPRLRCFAYAPPPVLSAPKAPAVAAVEINAFVNRHDVVPRMSLHNVFMLGKEAVAIDQLDLGILERIDLIRKGETLQGERPNQSGACYMTEGDNDNNNNNIDNNNNINNNKAKVIRAVARAKEQAKAEKHSELVAHFVPGRVFWIQSSEGNPGAVLASSCEEFQEILIVASVAPLEDHLMSNYRKALEAFPPPTVTFPPEASKR